ncbi:S-layer homology domain-containing protein [uncultured Oscillibacter sp.]|uniref:InlB B-repeat-containing protein n=1 Tax=uncultured Oscillibacter sp. TaxID=876091 RepID=UPI002602155E|nr:S-layer homology domain-containing protein [uncultured Oscillibacter sp.]
MKRRIFSILTALALCLGLLPLRAFAADAPVNNPVLDISEGGIFISKDTKGSDLCAYRQIKSDDDNKPFIPYTGAITITGTSKSWYNLTVIGVEATIRLQNARIAPTVTQDNDPGGLNALNIQRGAKVDLILEGTSTLKGSGSFRREHEGVAGILISEDSSTGASVLRISGIGTLNVEGGDSVRQVPSASSSPLEGGNGITFAGQAGLHVMGNATVNITGGNTGLARQYQGNGIWAEPSASSGGASLELSGGAMSVKGRFGCYMREAFQLRQTGGTFSMEGSGGFYSPDTAYQVEVSGGSMDVHSYGAEAINDLGKLTVGGKDTSVTLSTDGIRTDAVGGKTQFTVSPEVGYAAILKSGANEASAGRTPYPEETALSSVKGKYVNVTFSNERKNLTVTDGGAGSSGSGSYLPGQTVDISAGTLEGKSFKWWEHVSGDGRIANTGAADSTFTMGWEDAVIRPAFVTGHIFGDFAVNAEDDKIGDCSYNDGVLTISGSGTYAVSMATPGTTTGHRILLSGGSPTVILDSVLISSGSNSAIGLAYDKTTNATLMLSGTSVLSAATNGTTPGIAVWTNSKYAHASLTITSLKGDGSTDGRLEVSGGNGIGASGIRAAGNITIKGGTIIARGSGQTLNGGCGVGSTKGGRVTISGGDITATVSGGKFVQQAFCGGPTLENDPSIKVNGSFAHRVSGTNVRIYYDSQGGSSVRSVAVDPQSGAILAGETLQFTAQVEGGGNADKTVSWSVTGASSAGTSIDANGLLTVAPDETTETLTVTATNDYSGLKASAGVTVQRQSVFYSVTVETEGNGTASASPASAEAGTEIALTATPEEGYHFKEWQVVSGGVTISGDSFIMPAENVTVKAVFEQDIPPEPETYTVTVQTDGNGTASASPASATAGTEITLTATPDNGYHFKEWQVVSGGVTVSDDKFTMPGENVTVKAVFEQDNEPVPPPETYSVTVQTEGSGTASASPASAEAGTLINLTAAPDNGYHFKEWQVVSGGVTISDSKFTMPAEDVTVKAVFEQDDDPSPPQPETYTVTVQTEGNGNASATPASAEVGTLINLTASPDNGYHFKEWLVVSGGVTISDSKFTMPAENVTVRAVFEQDTTPPDPPDPPQSETYTVTVQTEGNGTASASPASATARTEITLTATPGDGYHFKEWQVVSGGAAISGNSFTMPAGNVTVKAVFEPDSDPTPPDPPPFDPDRVETAIEVKEGISEVPEGLSGIPALNTPAKLNAVMKTEITRVNPDIPLQNTAVYDVTLMISTDGGATWTPATADNFPSGGLAVTLPYPSGTNSGFRFTVVHMFTTTDFGKRPGDTERPAVTNVENGIQFTVTGLSPISVGWTAPAANPDTPSGGGHGGGGWSASTYAVTVEKPEHGKVASNRASASSNSTVTLTVTPDSGYELDTLAVTDSRGNAIRLMDQGGGKYTFAMPSRAVTVMAVFAPLPGDKQKPCDGGADCPSRGFTDLGSVGTWYHEAVDYVLRSSLMGGYGNGTFGPSNNLSRAQFAQILFNMEGRPVVNYLLQYGDVAEGAWYTEAIRWAASQGIIGGYSGGIFGPNDSITREQLAVMLWRYAGSPAATDKELRFTDADKAGGYALEALRWAVENSVMSGRGGGILDPKGLVTRAQAAQMLMNFQEK